jgi:hypothetical protein
MPAKLCLSCLQPFVGPGARHKVCDPRRAYNTSAERQRRSRTVQAWVQANGYTCPGHHRDPHPADPQLNPLQADHLVAIADGGDEHGQLGVLCRDCNLKKRHGKRLDLGSYDRPGLSDL